MRRVWWAMIVCGVCAGAVGCDDSGGTTTEEDDTAIDGSQDTTSADLADTSEDDAADDVEDGVEGDAADVAASCDDGLSNGEETGVDCGGSMCGPCADDERCALDADCDSRFCNPDSQICQQPSCGDGFVQTGETCDDSGESASCDDDCSTAMCGDGAVNATAGEACDDGNTVDGDSCTNACEDVVCGDGIVGPGEGCDDGNTDDADGCSNSCASQSCGDGTVQLDEACDDGNNDNTDDCLDTCVAAFCGDGYTHATLETCDSMGESVACNADCTPTACGDGVVNVIAGESCDDGNLDASDFCTDSCVANACDDAVLNGNETDQDCGGVDCGATCLAGQACTDDTDCAQGACLDGACGHPTDCVAWLGAGGTADGVYTIDPDGSGAIAPFDVYCDQTTDGGGWMLASKFSQHQSIAQLPQTTYDAYFVDALWIEGVSQGVPGSPVPDYTDYHIESLDWDDVLTTGQDYQLRQQAMKDTGSVEWALSFDFTYPGYVTQNDAPSDVERAWPLSNRRVLFDTSGVGWDVDDNEQLLFWLPIEPGITGSYYTGCQGYTFDATSCALTTAANRRYGNAGIIGDTADNDDPAAGFMPLLAMGNGTIDRDLLQVYGNTPEWGYSAAQMVATWWLRPDTCGNGVTDGLETATDCGGLCGGCAVGDGCVEPTDCHSGACTAAGVCDVFVESCAALLTRESTLPDGDYLIDPAGDGTTMAVHCDMTTDGGGWTRVAHWDREHEGDTVAGFQALMTLEVDEMGAFQDRPHHVRWMDNDGSYDSMAYSVPVPVTNGGELRSDIHFEGVSMEDSGVWFYATTASGAENVLCWDDTSGVGGFTAADLGWIPGYTCANSDPDLATIDWTWDRVDQLTMSGQVTALNLRSLMADTNTGDQARLYRYSVYVR